MRGWAFGLLRISREDFGLMREGEFWEAFMAFRQESDANRKHMGELIRGATHRLINIQLDPKDREYDLPKFWPMPWDPPVEKDSAAQQLAALSDEERNAAAIEFLTRTGQI